MALQYRKVVRDAVMGFLAASFNSTLAGMAATYGITPFTLDFSDGSANFAQSHIQPANIEKCQFTDFPAACLYSTRASDRGTARALPFGGLVTFHLDFYVRDREGVEGSDTESFFEAIEDAALSVLNNHTNQWPPGVIFARHTDADREPLIPLGDGFGTRIPIEMLFEVKRTSL